MADADPSGWLVTAPNAARLAVLPRLRRKNLVQYYVDEGHGFVGDHKESLARLLSQWENRPISTDEFTVCPSGSCASLVTLVSLRSIGVRGIRFETPTYYAAVEQAKLLGLAENKIPTFRHEDYLLSSAAATAGGWRNPFALWLTQPRFALGFDQSRDHLSTLLRELSQKNNFLVIDEVMDQAFPSTLRILSTLAEGEFLIRIRSFVKGMGLSGIRLAVIMHHPRLRRTIVDALEMLGGAVDASSLLAVTRLADDVPRFQSMLAAANAQVNGVRRQAERLVRGTELTINPLSNGYIGSMIADLSKFGTTQNKRRTYLLEGCRRVLTPIVLGASFYMAVDPPTEAIRLNFFIHPDNLLRGISNILGLW